MKQIPENTIFTAKEHKNPSINILIRSVDSGFQ
jgi:hypothetical protein